jgi:succinyl-diaminopimelate desuccinylase
MKPLPLTQELLRFNTINPPGNERACAQHLGRLLEAGGYAVTYHEFDAQRTSLIARIGGQADRPPLCFTGHLDTVPLGVQAWTHDPFAGEAAGPRLYGRGASDMKSGVAAFVVAALALAPGLDGSPGVVLVITAGEEMGCRGARHLAGLGDTLGRAGAIVVAEPTDNRPLVGHKGVLWLQARTSGLTAHGSMPERGVNAVYKAARAVLKLEQHRFDVAPHPVLGAPTLNVGTISGGLNYNSVPDASTIGIDIRTIPDQTHASIVAHLTSYLGPDVALEPVNDAPGIWTDPSHPWIRQVFDIVTQALGTNPAVEGAPYGTDATALTPAYGGAPTVILGPGELAMAHQTDEYCRIDRIEQAVDIYIEIARRWCGA